MVLDVYGIRLHDPRKMADLHHGIWIDADPSTVFEAVGSEDGFAAWWTPNVLVQGPPDLARYRFGFDDDTVYATFETDERGPPERLVLECVDGIEDWVGTRLVFELEPADEGTFVSFDHAGWAEEDWYFRACNSTWGHLMFFLKRACEGGAGEPFFEG